uniref:Uncharacterized protein n=1 Tax=Avena sativa TaxID=4498 RepID=A0ACD5VJ60_AVESA
MPSCCWFLVFIIWARWLPPMLAGGAQVQPGGNCSSSPKRCGNLTISDPFWLADIETGRSCRSGLPDFEVVCFNNNTPVILSNVLYGFAIINITYEERSLQAIDLGMLKLLHAANSCDIIPNWNTSARLDRSFQISDINLDLILYNCTEAARLDGRTLVETKMGCVNQHKVFASLGGHYGETSDDDSYVVEGCHTRVLPVMGWSSGQANASDYELLISYGFLMTWELPPPVLTGI